MKLLEEFLSELRQREMTLWLEGERLRYRAPEGSLSAADLAELRSRKAEVIAFLQAAKRLSSTDQPPLQPVPRDGHLPLSFAQQRFWFLYQFEPDSPANNLPVVMRFTGNLRLDVLQRSIAEVVRRHEVLRSRFPMVDGQPVLAISPDLEVGVPVVDLQGLPDEQRDPETHRMITKDARQPFDLEQGPLLRMTLFRLAEQEQLLLWNMPCIICDGTSSDLFYRELTACYVAYATGVSPNLPELPIQYADFANWQRHYLQGEVLETHLQYWTQQLSDHLTSLQLPIDYPRPSGLRTCRGDRYARMFSKALHHELLNLSQQLGTTLFVVLLTAFNLLLYRYSQQDDILTTFVSSGRNRVETENLIGFFSNTLILRTRLDRDLSFRELVGRVHRQNLDAYTHQELPFERLVDALSPEQRQGRSPLFQTKFTLNPPWTNGQGMAPVTLPDLTIESLFGYIYHGKTKADLTLVTREQDQGLGAVLDYNAELFTESTMERMMGHFQTILESIVVNPDQVISTMPILTAAEQQLLAEWSQSTTDLSTLLAESDLPDHLSSGAAGHHLAPTRHHVLDRHLQPVPIGVPGELYLGEIDNTANQPTTSLYKTGATVRYRPDGRLEAINGDEPLTKAHPNDHPTGSGTSPSACDAIERDLTEIWQTLLGIETIDVQDNFFDLGGHSLLAVQLFARVEETFGQRLPLSTLLQAPTIAQLAAILRSEQPLSDWSPLVEIQTGGSKPPLFCIHGGGFNVLVYRSLALNLSQDQPVYGLQARNYDPKKGILDSMESLATDYVHEIQRVQPQGPYLLAGLSNGGNIALEMAQQLQAQGHEVALLAMFDSYGPNGLQLLSPLPRLLSSLQYVLRYTVPRILTPSQPSRFHTLLATVQKTVRSLRLQPSSSHLSTQPSSLEQTTARDDVQTPDSIYSSLEQGMNRISQYILDHSPWAFFSPSAQLKEMDDVVSTLLKQMEESYCEIHKSYQPQPYTGKITLFRAAESPPGYWIDPNLGWSKIARGGIEKYKIPGHHTAIMESPILAEKLDRCIAVVT